MQYCSLQHRTLISSPVTSTARCCFCFGSVSSFFLELFLHWSQVAYWAPTSLGSSSFSVLSFCLFILFIGYSRQEYWSGLPFPSPGDDTPSKRGYPVLTAGEGLRTCHKRVPLRNVSVRGLQQGVPKEPTKALCLKNGQYLDIDYARGFFAD